MSTQNRPLLTYQQLCGKTITFPGYAYQGLVQALNTMEKALDEDMLRSEQLSTEDLESIHQALMVAVVMPFEYRPNKPVMLTINPQLFTSPKAEVKQHG